MCEHGLVETILKRTVLSNLQHMPEQATAGSNIYPYPVPGRVIVKRLPLSTVLFIQTCELCPPRSQPNVLVRHLLLSTPDAIELALFLNSPSNLSYSPRFHMLRNISGKWQSTCFVIFFVLFLGHDDMCFIGLHFHYFPKFSIYFGCGIV